MRCHIAADMLLLLAYAYAAELPLRARRFDMPPAFIIHIRVDFH